MDSAWCVAFEEDMIFDFGMITEALDTSSQGCFCLLHPQLSVLCRSNGCDFLNNHSVDKNNYHFEQLIIE